MILLIDNYDSFTYNLYQALGIRTKQPIKVVKNDQVNIKDLEQPEIQGLVLSPGPGRPENAGNMNQVLKAAIGKLPILGICLGHQAIGEVYGAKVVNAPLMHGKTCTVHQTEQSNIFKNCLPDFTIGRYHSLMIDPNDVPKDLTISATADDGTIQAVTDEKNHVYGIEFHPESIMTDQTAANHIFNNFIALTEVNTND